MPKNKSNKSNKTKQNKINNKLKQMNNKIKRLRQNNNKSNRNRMPAANTKNMNRDFRILYQDGNTVRVTGRDLVYQIPSDIVSQYNADIITVIPANPCYWIGTRIAALAQGYQNYRPLSIKFNYIPQCAVTQQGNVIAGTLWNQAPSNVNLQQSLRTSNGGQLSQCYKPFTSIVRMKTNLQYNLYKTAGQFDQESNPFVYIAMSVGCLNENKQNIVPGYFYVTWSFVLKNPIGNTNIFFNSGLRLYSDTGSDFDNNTVVFLNANESELPRGAILQVEKDENGDPVATYNGSYYDLEGDDLVWQFSNSTIQNAQQPQPDPPQQNTLHYDFLYKPPFEGQTPVRIKWMIAENNDNPDYWTLLIFNTYKIQQLSGNKDIYVLSNEDQLPDPSWDFTGYYFQSDNDGMIFLIPKDAVQLVNVNDQLQKATTRQRIKKSKNKFENLTKPKNLIRYVLEDKVRTFKLEEEDPFELHDITEKDIKYVQPETLIQQHARVKAKSQPKYKAYTNSIPELDECDS